jgi:hypothetical protein
MAASKTTAAASVCEDGGPEIPAMSIRVRPDDIIDFSAFVCNTAARIRVVVTDSTTGVDQVIIDQIGLSKASATLPRLRPGPFTLLWSYIGASAPWQTRTEVAVNGTNRFLHRKGSGSDDPFLRGFLLIEVTS